MKGLLIPYPLPAEEQRLLKTRAAILRDARLTYERSTNPTDRRNAEPAYRAAIQVLEERERVLRTTYGVIHP